VPIYEYKCENGHVFDAIQKMTDDPLTACEQCGAPVERVFHPVAVHFKGSGFYTTDYGKKKAPGNGGGREAKESGGSGESKSSESSSSDSKSSESKPDSKPAASAGD
jgi:putative FmdB family regulatory protein